MLVLQIISLLITASGALLGTLWDFRRDGRVTGVGIAAVALVVAGFIASAAILLVKDHQQRRAESRADEQRRRANRLQETLLRTQLKEKNARQLTLSVSLRRPVPSDSALVTFVETRNGTYAFVIPQNYPHRGSFGLEVGIVRGRHQRMVGGLVNGRFKWQRGTIDNGRFRRLSHGDLSFVELGRFPHVEKKRITVSIEKRGVRREDWLIDVAADVERVEHYFAQATRGRIVARDLRRGLGGVASVRLSVDDFPVHTSSKTQFSNGLIIARPEGASFASGDYVEGQFFDGPPPWERLVSAAASGKDPGSVFGTNEQKGGGAQVLRPD